MVRYITLIASSVRYVHNSIIRASARFRDSLPQTPRPTRGKFLLVFLFAALQWLATSISIINYVSPPLQLPYSPIAAMYLLRLLR